jgi:ribose transport system substrate-binding protein
MFKRTLSFLPALSLCALWAVSGCNQSGTQSADSGANTANGNTAGNGSDASGGAPNASGKKPRVAYVTNGVASFWVIAAAGAKAAGQKFNADVTVHEPASISDQKRIIEDLMTRGVDGIAISPINPDDQTSLINKAADVTKVITHDSDAPKSKRLCYIGMDNYTAGRMCGKLVKEALPKGGKLAIFVGRLEQDNAKGRRQGVIDELLDRSVDPKRYDVPGSVIKNNKYTIVGTYTDQFDQAKGKANAEDVLSRHPDLDGMVGLFAYNPPLCLEALERAGKEGKIKLIGFDEADETLQGIKDGTCYGTIVQDPYAYGFESVRVLTALANNDQSVMPKGGFLNIPARQIRKNNVDAFWKDLKQKLGKAPAKEDGAG